MKNKLRMNTQYIDFYLQKHQISKEEFAKRCDITLKELNDVYSQKNIDIFLMIKIVKLLQITSDTFLFMEKYHPKRTFSRQTKNDYNT